MPPARSWRSISSHAGWPSSSRRTSRAYHRMLAGLSASIEMIARISLLPATCGQDSSLTLIKPPASGAPSHPARSVRSTSGHLSTSTIEHATTRDIARTVATCGQILLSVHVRIRTPRGAADVASGWSHHWRRTGPITGAGAVPCPGATDPYLDGGENNRRGHRAASWGREIIAVRTRPEVGSDLSSPRSQENRWISRSTPTSANGPS